MCPAQADSAKLLLSKNWTNTFGHTDMQKEGFPENGEGPRGIAVHFGNDLNGGAMCIKGCAT